MTYPNTHPAPVMVYGGAPSFDEATAPNPFAVIADLRAGLDVAKRLREHLPGDAPELQQADETIAALEAAIDAASPAASTTADLADELATLRADNDARGVLIEELRVEMTEAYAACDKMAAQRNGYMAERDQARANAADANRRNEALAAELDTVRSERDAAREELTAYRDTDFNLCRELDDATMKLDNVRRDRDKYFAAYQRTLRALNAALGEP